jgi:hypothetical protein
VFVALNTIQGANRSAQTQVASDALMHSQRIGKAAPNAVQGSVEGFRQLEESRKELNKDINLMTRGGQYQGRSIGEPSADIAVVVAAARKQWTATDLAAGTILTLKADLSGMDKTLQTLHEMSPDLLVRTEDHQPQGAARRLGARDRGAGQADHADPAHEPQRRRIPHPAASAPKPRSSWGATPRCSAIRSMASSTAARSKAGRRARSGPARQVHRAARRVRGTRSW